ncbi:hypothetical protein BDQ12DRAFT_729459 [Crucibulum laeve]|uniref:Uncharacterized protein n=1 Tax=Crucibulum laeve TaxID=68775 RepID=A0A5C3LFR9_9AGAR|nr:hypothetical protein BDQ12DRAFT_729459 [Crucibulum laeve]
MATVDLSLSVPSSSILLSLLASVVLLAAIRAAVIYLRPQGPAHEQHSEKLILAQEQGHHPLKGSEGGNTGSERPTSSWGWGFLTWESLPALPVSLTMSEHGAKGRGVGLGAGSMLAKQQQQTQNMQQQWQRRGPAFERPLPALYQTEVPASMAKMIMSRHTFRRPASRPPPRSATTIPPIQIQRRTPSMV